MTNEKNINSLEDILGTVFPLKENSYAGIPPIQSYDMNDKDLSYTKNY